MSASFFVIWGVFCSLLKSLLLLMSFMCYIVLPDFGQYKEVAENINLDLETLAFKF